LAHQRYVTDGAEACPALKNLVRKKVKGYSKKLFCQ